MLELQSELIFLLLYGLEHGHLLDHRCHLSLQFFILLLQIIVTGLELIVFALQLADLILLFLDDLLLALQLLSECHIRLVELFLLRLYLLRQLGYLRLQLLLQLVLGLYGLSQVMR